MHIEFEAMKVTYNEAIDGEIVHVIFEENEDDGDAMPACKYLLISTAYEFGSPSADAEWYDGENYNGGIRVIAYKLGEGRAIFHLKNGYIFEIGHNAAPSTLDDIQSYLSRHSRELNA